ncbi:hypothetical protein B5U98_26815 [Bosea sp. Tri-39]|nr:hypothetical protein BLM15_29010 [Bosea sp. Tri-49]RXT16777.1 hypothetical protein B5U98_26815 [Bosea sp. Tri-39]
MKRQQARDLIQADCIMVVETKCKADLVSDSITMPHFPLPCAKPQKVPALHSSDWMLLRPVGSISKMHSSMHFTAVPSSSACGGAPLEGVRPVGDHSVAVAVLVLAELAIELQMGWIEVSRDLGI